MLASMMPGIPLVAQAEGAEGVITIEMTDTYGDSWNGNAIEIYANGKLVDTATITDPLATGTWTGKITGHATYTFKWVEGSFHDETGFVIYMGTDQKLSAGGADYAGGDTILTVSPECGSTTFEDGICTNCGEACVHVMNDAGLCGICGYECPNHSFTGGVCAACGGVCSHPMILDGECTLCCESVYLTIDMMAEYSYGWENCARITVLADGTEIGVAREGEE